MSKEEILKGLSDDQKLPVKSYHGPSIVLAGPGSGKTHTSVSRAAYMIEDGIDPGSLLMFTFTNKAAKEIKERVVKRIGDAGSRITVGTYHSICARLLREYAPAIGYKSNFTIFDSEDSLKTLSDLVKGLSFDNKKALSYISDCKNKMKSPIRALQDCKNDYESGLAEVYRKYQEELFKQGAMDFDDLIYNMIIVLERNNDIKQVINGQYKYIVADEFHDSSKRDIRFIELLAGEQQNICMVLDDEQSIYAFRGADISAVLGVNNIFNNVQVFVLKQNYRSTNQIVSASRSLIAKNKCQMEKEIYTENEEGSPVVFFEENNQSDEGMRVLKLVMLLKRKYELKYKDIAILYRMSYLSRQVEEAFLKNAIPYQIIGGTPFYSRKEVKDILCYARFMVNPYDYQAFKRVINTPKRGIGEKSLEKIFNYARTEYVEPITFIQACEEIELKGKAGKGLKEFNNVVIELQENMMTDSAPDFLCRIIELIDYTKMIEEADELGKSEERLENLMELISIASVFDSLDEFLQNIVLDPKSEDDEDSDNKVQMLTMHSSKGLEYKAVIIIGSNEGTCPHWRAQTEKEVEEERRLFYVAMTRAEKYLFLTRSKIVIQNGSATRTIQSRFIKEIDRKYIESL
jgi:DNA helicase-2/ATP-dependent DNA helicase PcrA